MLSRRFVIAGGVATLAGSAIAARAQTSPAETPGVAAAPTVLRLERRDIEVNGKTASVFGIRQPGGAFGLVTDIGKPFRVRVENDIDEPSLNPLARAYPALATRRRAGHFRTPDSPRRQRRLRFPVALRRHVLDALPSGPAGAAADGRAAHHPGSARPRGPAGGRGHARRFQLHAPRADFRGPEEERVDGRHGVGRRRASPDVQDV